LRVYCNYQQSDWARLLLLAKFTYNNTPSYTTGVSPVFTNKRYHLKAQFLIEGSLTPGLANKYTSKLEEIHTKLKQTIQATQCHYQVVANKRHSLNPEIKVGNQVFILAKFVRMTQPFRKLAECYLGLFEVVDKPGTYSYLIKLPNHLQNIHPVFHILQLEPAYPRKIPNHVNYHKWLLI